MVTKCYYKWISNLLTISFLTHMQAFLLRHHNCHYLDKLQARIIVKSSLFCQYNSSLDFVRIFCYFGKRYKIMRYRYDVYDDKDTVRSKDSISQNPKHVTNQSSCILPNTHSCSFVKLHLYLFVLTLKIVKANADNHFDVKYMMP